jgi:hypothetical protein
MSVHLFAPSSESRLCLLSTDTYGCFPLPSGGSRGRPLREPCGSPPSSVLWGRKTAPHPSVSPPVDPWGHVPPATAVQEEMESSPGFVSNLCGSLPRASDSGDSSPTSR